MRLSVLILLNNTHQIAHLSLLYLACRAGTTELFYGAWSTKKLACFIMSCSTDGLVSFVSVRAGTTGCSNCKNSSKTNNDYAPQRVVP